MYGCIGRDADGPMRQWRGSPSSANWPGFVCILRFVGGWTNRNRDGWSMTRSAFGAKPDCALSGISAPAKGSPLWTSGMGVEE